MYLSHSAEDLEEMTLTIFSLETSNEDLTRTVERLEKEIAIKNVSTACHINVVQHFSLSLACLIQSYHQTL